MDFLKACTTNIHAVENLVQTAYCVYDWSDPEVGVYDRWEHAQKTVAALRRDNVLCARIRHTVWIFGHLGDEQKSNLDSSRAGFSISQEGTLESPPTHAPDGRPVRDILLEAVEHALAFALARDPAIVHVGPWLWLYHSVYGDDTEQVVESSLIHLHTKFTPTGGLYLIPKVMPSACQPVSTITTCEDKHVLLAPHGKLATLLPEFYDGVVLSDDTWKSSLAEALESHGINLSGPRKWTAVRIEGKSTATACVWPADLCFARPRPDHTLDKNAYADRDWRRWFISTEEGTIFRSPWSMAEEWFKRAANRERSGQAAANAQSSGHTEDLDATNSTTAHASASEDTTMTSPPFSQRVVDQQAAMAGIYPTPPDGYIPPQNASQVNAMTPSVTQAEQNSTSGYLISTSDSMQEKFADAPLLGQDTYQSGDQDMLFGDEGDIEFGEDAIGDADFNFFDDPDDDPTAMPLENTGLEDTLKHVGDTEDIKVGNDGNDAHINHLEQAPDVPSTEVVDQMELASIEKIEDDERDRETHGPKLLPLISPVPKFGRPASEPEKPLSPFGIRERLLPPPVPASFSQSGTKEPPDLRRNSTFAPINFNDGLNLSRKYSSALNAPEKEFERSVSSSGPNIGLPTTRKKNRVESSDDSGTDSESESEDNSDESSSSDMDEEELPPRLPWESRKRKRHPNQDSVYPLADRLERMLSDDEFEERGARANGKTAVVECLEEHVASDSAPDIVALIQTKSGQEEDQGLVNNVAPSDSVEALRGPLPRIEKFHDLPSEDLIYIAQIINDQSTTALSCDETSFDTGEVFRDDLPVGVANYIHNTIERGIEAVFPDVDQCDLSKVALNREPLRAPPNPGKAPQGPPRPPQRSDSTMLGPDYFHIAPPHVRIQRSAEAWEMLPTCLKFWEALGLGPANGAKNVRAFCIFPENEHLERTVKGFMADIGTAYENCKLGSHVHLRSTSETDEHDNFEDGMAPVELNEDASLEGALKSYAATCVDLGEALSNVAHQENDRAIVVYILNPFFGQQAQQHLCACFWMLFKAYRDNLPKARRNQAGSDIFLQLLPISMVAAYDALVVPDAKQMAILTREVYDRCPPSTPSPDNTSALPILAAPAVELASAAPKRIGFQLAAEPPTDLLHEGSVLHVAYAISKDGLWMSVCWIDTTGKHQSSASFCLRGRSLAEVIEDVWECTRNILTARQVLWRIFIATTDAVDNAVLQCWRSLSAKPRPQAVCVTLLTIDSEPVLQLSPPITNLDGQLDSKSDGGFLTPASTPQAGTFTSSPDVTGTGGGNTNAPPTPVPSEAAASIAENDPDAHLTDLTDETWGVLLSSKLINVGSNTGLANGALFKRGEVAILEGESSPAHKLPSLGVSIHWTIQVKPSGGVDEGSVKQAELTLREVLRMYRNLSLLTRARALSLGSGRKSKKTDLDVPVHIVAAVRGAEGLDGMLSMSEDD